MSLSKFLLAVLLGTLLSGCKFPFYAEARSHQISVAETAGLSKEELGIWRFTFDDLGGLNTDTLETNAFPWKVVVTAMVMQYADAHGTTPSAALIPVVLQQYGWITPTGIDNWRGARQPIFDKPIGIVSGEIRRDALPKLRLEVANMGCAACHAGMSYDTNGKPTGHVWLGSSNSSRFFDGYTNGIIASLRYVSTREPELMTTIRKVFPDVHPDEMETIRKYVLPQVIARLKSADEGKEILVAFNHGGAGLTNGIAALKLRLGGKPGLLGENEYGYASIPDLYGRRLRSSVLYDGLYALEADKRFVLRKQGDFSATDHQRLASIVAFFIVPSMGIRPTETEKQAGRISDILDWLLDYTPQPYPGSVDPNKAMHGSLLFSQHCANCHGQYSNGIDKPQLLSYPNRLVPQAAMNSDPQRWMAITDAMVQRIWETPVADKVNAANAQGYVAPILNGLWTSAPYLHNGSVPTVWHLMHAASRPARFLVGGHAVDLQRLGIAGEPDVQGTYRYAKDYAPWSTAVLIDTSKPGLGNGGHEKPFDGLSEDEKQALLEYLKLL